MKQITLAILLVFLSITAFTQNTVLLKHKQYETNFDTSLKYPKKVYWVVTKKSLTCVTKYPRSNKFVADPLLPKQTDLDKDYVKSGYDRGHNFTAADAACDSTSMRESFFFSNMTPQHPTVNRGDWKQLEEFTRELSLKHDSVKVWSGSWGVQTKAGRVSVPTDCWKVIYIVSTKEWMAFHFFNTRSNTLGLKSHEVSVDFIEKQTGYKFK
jgi:endonuclease G